MVLITLKESNPCLYILNRTVCKSLCCSKPLGRWKDWLDSSASHSWLHCIWLKAEENHGYRILLDFQQKDTLLVLVYKCHLKGSSCSWMTLLLGFYLSRSLILCAITLVQGIFHTLHMFHTWVCALAILQLYRCCWLHRMVINGLHTDHSRQLRRVFVCAYMCKDQM